MKLHVALEDTIQQQYQLNSPLHVYLAELAFSVHLLPPTTLYLANLDLSARTCQLLDLAPLDFSKTRLISHHVSFAQTVYLERRLVQKNVKFALQVTMLRPVSSPLIATLAQQTRTAQLHQQHLDLSARPVLFQLIQHQVHPHAWP